MSPQTSGSARQVRVGFIIDFLYRGAGTENQLILILRSLDRRRVSPFLAVLNDGYSESMKADSVSSVEVDCPLEVLHVSRIATVAGLRGIISTRAWARARKLDVIVTFFRDANIIGTLGGWLAGVPLVSCRRNLGRGYWHTGFELQILRVLNRLTRVHVSNSYAVRSYTIEAEKVKLHRIQVIRNAVDLEKFSGPRTSVEARRAHLGLPSGVLICCVANLRPIKNVDLLVRAYISSSILREIAYLVLVGTGPEEDHLRLLCDAAGASDGVLFLGRRSDVPEILTAVDIAALPSKGESLPNAVLEYMASGLPTVATAVGGVPELLEPGPAGILVESGDEEAFREGLEALAIDKDLRTQLGRQARETVERDFALDHVMDHWMGLFERLSCHSGRHKFLREGE